MGQLRGPVREGGEEIDGGAPTVAPVDALPTPESNGAPNRLGGAPTALGVKVVTFGGGPKMLGGVPTIGAAPVEGVPTLPMGLPGVL